jgi:hypothetical protein
VGLGAGLDAEAREKSFASVGDRTPIVQSAVRHCTDSGTLVQEMRQRINTKTVKFMLYDKCRKLCIFNRKLLEELVVLTSVSSICMDVCET